MLRDSTVASALAALVLTASGCASTDSPVPEGFFDDAAQTALGHVHGVGVDPADGTLLGGWLDTSGSAG